jgi:hypothetical protein
MKEIGEFEVKQVRIFPIDSLPFVRLITPAVATAFKEQFGWGGVEIPSEGEVLFRPGLLADAEAKDAVVIKGLQLNERRMILNVMGDSRTANRVHKAICDFFAGNAGWRPVEPLILTEETTCVATLAFEWTRLLSPALREFAVGNLLERLSTQSPATPEIRGVNLSFRLAYPDLPPNLREHGVALSDKKLTIEPRVNTPLSDRRYYTFSPSDSETHLQLLEHLERRLTNDSR